MKASYATCLSLNQEWKDRLFNAITKAHELGREVTLVSLFQRGIELLEEENDDVIKNS